MPEIDPQTPGSKHEPPERACSPRGWSSWSPSPSSASLHQKLMQTQGLCKKINEMYPLVLIPDIGVMAVDCAYALGGGRSAIYRKLSALAQHICSLHSPRRFWKIQSVVEGSPICLLEGLPYQWVETANTQTLISRLQDWGLKLNRNHLPSSSGQPNQNGM